MRAVEFSNLARCAKADALTALLDGGWLCLYDAGGEELARLRFSEPAFYPAVAGVAESLPLEPDAGARAFGCPVRFRAYTGDMEDVLGGSAGLRGDGQEYDLEVDGDVQEGGEVVVGRLMYEEPRSRNEVEPWHSA